MKEKMEVKDYIIEYTGGNIYVAWGSFKDGRYFSIGSDMLFVYDEDEYVAMNDEEYDGYTWEQQHCLASYDYTASEYKNVLSQIFETYKSSEKYRMDLFDAINNE